MAFICVAHLSASDEWVLFVNSEPIGATVLIDDRELPGTTPLIVRESTGGVHTFTIRKDGYESAIQELVLQAGQVTEIAPELIPAGLSVSLPRNDTAVVGGSEITAGDSVLQLTGDRFVVERDAGTVLILPNPRLQRLGDALSIAAPIMAGFGILLTADAISNPPADGPVLPPTVIAVHAVTAAIIGTDIGIQIARARAARSFRVAVEARGDPAREQRLLEDADSHLSNGDIERALEKYNELIAEFPASDRVPEALHRSAGVLILLGDTQEARNRFARIIAEMPEARFYDTSLKNLADISYQRGETAAALSYLDRIVYLHAPFSREEIDAYSAEIRASAD